jgi:hypothetical protein
MYSKILETIAILLALGGTLLLAFGLKIKAGIQRGLAEELDLVKRGLIVPTDVRQNAAFFMVGLGMVSLAAAIQIILMWFL